MKRIWCTICILLSLSPFLLGCSTDKAINSKKDSAPVGKVPLPDADIGPPGTVIGGSAGVKTGAYVGNQFEI